MELGILILRSSIAAVFAVAAIAKLTDIKGSAKAMSGFGIPDALAVPFSIGLVIVELTLAMMLLIVRTSWFGAIGAALVLLIFTVVMAYHYFNGNVQDCHCFGQLAKEPVGVASIIRNAVLLVITFFIIARGASGQGTELISATKEDVSIILLTAIAIMMAIALIALRKLVLGQSGLAKRIDLIETIGIEGREVSREDAGNPNDGLPIGAKLPFFVLQDTAGERYNPAKLLVSGKPLLMFFVSPKCGPCQAMAEEFDNWNERLSEKATVVFVSSGKALTNLEKFGAADDKLILLQNENELAEAMFAKWTPSAVIVDPDGRIASGTAAGDEAMRKLIQSFESTDSPVELAKATTTGTANSKLIGKPLPHFQDELLDGDKLTPSSIQGKAVLMTFWSRTCPFCMEMRDDLIEWVSNPESDDPEIIIFSDDDDLGTEFKGKVVVDPEYTTAGKLGMQGTPSAILVNKDGIVISETAVGAPNIRALIGRRNVEQ